MPEIRIIFLDLAGKVITDVDIAGLVHRDPLGLEHTAGMVTLAAKFGYKMAVDSKDLHISAQGIGYEEPALGIESKIFNKETGRRPSLSSPKCGLIQRKLYLAPASSRL